MFRNITVILSANSTSFVSQMKAAGVAVDNFNRQATSGSAKVTTSAMGAHKALTALAVVAGALLVKGIASAVSGAAQLERAMHNVATISDSVAGNIGKATKTVIDLSTKLPQSAKTLAEGLYEIASSGFQGAAGMEVLQKSAVAASAGLTTTNVAAKGITAVLNAYGRSAADAGDVSDVLFQTVNLGVVTFEELSGQIGDFVGTASQLGVPIEDAASAFAAMTLSGISAAESATSLNRVMLSFIKPSEGMTAVLKANNFESGVAAVKTLGLKGAMELLGRATGGSVEAMAELFPEVRGLRGALALLAAEGDNYNRTAAGIADANARAGATQKAFNEQMKAASAQWAIFKNQIQAGAIAIGASLLPVLVSVMKGLQELGRDAAPQLHNAIAALAPVFSDLAEAGGNVLDVLANMTDGVEPLVTALATIAGTGVVATLAGLASVLKSVTGFASEHESVITALAIVYGVRLATSIALTTTYMAVWNAHAIAATITSSRLALAIGQQVQYFGLLGLAIRAVPYVAIVAGIAATIQGISNAKREADQLSDSLKKGADLSTVAGLNTYLAQVNTHLDEMREKTGEGTRVGRFFKAILEFATPLPNTLADASEGIKQLEKDELAAGKAAVSLAENTAAVAHATGLSETAVTALAKKLNVDLTQGFNQSGEARQKIIDDANKLDAAAKNGFGGLATAAGMSVEAIQDAAKAVEDLAKKVGEGFSSSFDLVTNFASATKDHAKALEDLESASDKVASAQDKVAQAGERAADAQDKIVDAQERAAEAADGVVEAQDRVVEAEEKVAQMRVDFAERAAEAQEDYAEKVQQNDEDILRAEEDLADKRISLAQDVADAQRKLDEDRLEGQERINAAQQRILDVQKRASDDARERQQRDADRRRLDAASSPEERRRIQSEIDARKAREDDAKAREQAARDLKEAQDDLAKAREDAAETEKKDREALAKAQEDQAKGIEDAERAVVDARKDGLRLQKEGQKLARQAIDDEKELAQAVKGVEDARKGVIDAQKNASDAVKDIARAQADAARAGGEMGKAQGDLADAYRDLADAQQKVADTSLEGFFAKQIADANKFVDGIREAAARGLDPKFIAKLMQEGPEAAAPILDAILQDQTGTLIAQFNNASDTLSKVQSEAVMTARVTQRAIQATTQQMADDYETAMQILAIKAAEGGAATSQAIADKLRIGVTDVRRISQEYILGIVDGINPVLRGIGAPPVTLNQQEGVRYSGNQQFATGGKVPGVGDADTMPILATPGEYVARKKVVQEQGVTAFNALNEGKADIVPRFATGGFVYPTDVPPTPDFSAYGDKLGYSADETMKKLHDDVARFLADHPPQKTGSSGPGGSNYGFQALIDYLNMKGVPFEVTSTTGGTHAENSRHGQGLAADFVSDDMSRIGDAFMDIRSSMYELIHNPGYSVKGGENVDPSFWGEATWAGHDNHVHAATFRDANEGPGIPGASGGGGGGGAGGELYDWIDEAMRFTGVPGSWREALYRRAMYESSGDPTAQNNYDSNAQAGTPSKGLMQTIDSTFNAYKAPGHDDIWNPVDNLIAAIGYIIDRYGDISAIDPPTSGYKAGGLVEALTNVPKLHEGGIVPGTPGKDVLALLQGGEGVLSRHAMAMSSPVAERVNNTISTALSGYAGQSHSVPGAPPIDTKALAAYIGEEVTNAFIRAGIEVKADHKVIGKIVSKAQHRGGRR